MGVCANCSRALPPNQKCLYCGSPEFMAEGEYKKRGGMDALRVAIKRILIVAVIGALAFFLFKTTAGREVVTYVKSLLGK